MQNLGLHDTTSYAPETPTCDAPDQYVFERIVKSYYHEKFLAFISKIDQFMAVLVNDSPLTPLNPPPLTPLTSLYLSA